MSFKLIPLLIIFFTLSFLACAQNKLIESPKYDSILKYRAFGDDNSRSLDIRFKYAERAVELSQELEVDSIILKSNRTLSLVLLFQGKYDDFAQLNHQNLKLSKSLNDSLAIGVANHNLGYYHQGNSQNDSAYHYYSKAIKIYDNIGEITRQTGALSNLSMIQQIERDYFGSEETAIHAIELIQTLPKNEFRLDELWALYNRLGNISSELGQYKTSLEYHEKALEIAAKMENGLPNKYTTIHNQANVFRKTKDYAKALDLYNEIINNGELFEDDPTFYPLVLDNIAFTKFEAGEKDYQVMDKMFKEAYRISDSLDDPITKLAVTIDLAKFYRGQNKLEEAVHFAKESYDLAKQTSSNDILLESMLVLSQLTPGEEGKKYLNEHIRLSDSLLQHERGIRNKFARVQFETDQIEQENERIATQRFWLLMVSIGLLLTIFLLYIIITQRAKNKELQFEREQQQTNEEIYNLMLSQQDKVDEARATEKKRISEELHDGILGRLFGTRLSLGSLNYNDSKEAIQKRMAYIDDLQSIESDIRKISHDLNTDFVAGSGFMDIVETLIQNQTQAYQLTCDFYYSDDINWEEITNKTKIHIYRILQETMQNSYKHAEASHINISFHLKNNVIWLTISDDGKGFEINKSKKGIGLKNINSRVEEVGGTVQFASSTDNGTTITIQIPYSK